MSRQKKFVSLNLKMAIVTLMGIFLAVCMYMVSTWFSNYMISVNFTSEPAIERNVNAAFADLEEYIEENHVKATDTDALRNWVSDQDYTYLYIWDNENVLLDAGWAVTPSSSDTVDEGITEDNNVQQENYLKTADEIARIEPDTFQEDVRNRIIQYEDRKYYTYIDVYKEEGWLRITETVSLVLSFLTLFLVLILYHSHIAKRIMNLAKEVNIVSDGNLEHEIKGTQKDEIGMLADGVNVMRDSIIQKHQSEKDAWEANNQLITSMSHDIRTPLTSMIGYLDIIEGRKYESQEDLERYISSCRDKAFQLKDLSDKLFQYFLVFGNKANDREMEVFDASILFQQLLSEHSAEIISYGYQVEFYFNIPEVQIKADISGLRRLFDNIFSNIMKYADKKEVVCIYAETEADNVKILAINGMPEEAKKVESTRIGLKTCEKICSDLGGDFSYDEQERIFTVRILIPIMPAEELAQEEDAQAQTEEVQPSSKEVLIGE